MGVHGQLKIFENKEFVAEIKGRNIKFEQGVTNARYTDHNSSVDIFVKGRPELNIEIKNYHGSTKISKDVLKSQFIERDLFNAKNLNEIRWYQVGTSKTSKDEIINMLKTKECREALEKLSNTKKNMIFKNYNTIDGVTDKNLEQFISDNFNTIFK